MTRNNLSIILISLNKASVPQSINDDLYDEVNHSLELELTSLFMLHSFFGKHATKKPAL